MTKNELLNKISESLEVALSEYYTENNISSGDITPEQSLKWDGLVSQMAELFEELAEENR